MAGTLRNMLVRVGADISGLKKGMADAQKQVKYFGRNVTGSMKEMQGTMANAMAVFGGGMLLGQGIQDAMRYEALMATMTETVGESVKTFESWENAVGHAMGFSRLQGVELANTLSLNFKKIAVDSEDLVNKTTKMMEIAAIISNKRGRTMEDVSDRIRSAMNQEADAADELGVNVRVAAIEQSTAYQQMANGQPWDKLNEYQRKTILYNHILESVTRDLGTTIQSTTASRMASFTASLADVRMALGQAFLPILYNVLPLLNTMAQALYRALQVVAAFTSALFGGFKFSTQGLKATNAMTDATKAQTGAVKGLGDAQEKSGKQAKKAAKDAKLGVASFDEVNTLNDPSESAGAGAGGGGGGGGGGGDVPEMGGPTMKPPDFSSFTDAVDRLAEQFKKKLFPLKKVATEVWNAISGFAIVEFSKIKVWWDEYGPMITQAFKNVFGFLGAILMPIISFIWDSIKGLVEGILLVFRGILTFFGGIFTGDFKAAWEGLKMIFFGAIQAIWNWFNLTFIGGIKKLFVDLVVSGSKTFLKFVDDFKKMFDKGLKDVVKFFKDGFKKVEDFFLQLGSWMDGRLKLMETGFKNFWKGIENGAKTAVEFLKSVWGGIKEWFLRNIINPVINDFERIKDGFSKGIGQGFKEIINQAIKGFNNALSGFNRLKNATPFGDKIPDLRIPMLAKGGIATAATLAIVGEGRQDEAIAPLDKLQGFISNAVMAAMNVAGGNNSGGDIILNIDGRRLARIVKPHLDAETKRVGTNVRLNQI